MEPSCQRCNALLREDDHYCPACGLPQLKYDAAELPALPAGDEIAAESEQASVPGSELAGSATGIAWRPALQASLMLAIPAGIFCSSITPVGPSLGLVWMMVGSAWAVWLYAKRTRPNWVSAGGGARIGLVTGLLATWLTLGLDGAMLWAQRFLWHQGVQLDAEWLAYVDKVVEMDQQMLGQMGMGSAQATQSLQSQRLWMLSPEGHAGFGLMIFLTGSAFLIIFAIIGGAVGARFMAQPRRRGA